MATVTERIRLLFDIDDKAAVGSFGNITKSIANADGARGKMHAGLTATGDYLKANMAEAALAAGAALVAFGTKAVIAFQDTALEAGKVSDALGINVEDASRLMEVAGDLGIDMGTLQGAMQRFNKEVGSGRVDLKEFGTDLVYAKDGSVDAYESFINAATAVGAIKDPTDRAREAQRLFGRSYGEIAEMMEMSAEDLRTALAGVSEQKVIDEDELDKARDFRGAVDNLKDRFEDLQLAVGEGLTPVLTDLATAIEGVDSAAEQLGLGGLGGMIQKVQTLTRLGNPFGATLEGIRYVTDSIDRIDLTTISLDELVARLKDSGFSAEQIASQVAAWNEVNGKAATSTDDLADEVADLDDKTGRATGKISSNREAVQKWSDEMRRAETATRELKDEYARLTGQLNNREAWLNVEEAVGDFMTIMGDAEASSRDQELALIDVKQKLIEYLSELEGVPAEKQTQILSLIDEGSIGAATAQLDALARTRTAQFQVMIEQVTSAEIKQMENRLNRDINGNGIIGKASGGPVHAGETYLVGEQGPELLQMGNTSGNIIPNHALGSGSGGGSTVINITTNADPNSTKAALRRWSRRNGPGLS